MQKHNSIRNAKWELQDAIHLLSQGVDATLNIGWQRPAREIITTMNRDRPGGHKQLNTNRAGYIISDPYMKQKNRKKDRQKQKRYAKECLEFHWQWLQEEEKEEEEIARDFLDWYFEDDEYHLDYKDDWDDYREEYGDWKEDHYVPRDFDWDYGCSYEEYYVGSDYSLTRESMEIEVEYILNLYTTHEISHHEAKRRIVDLL